MINETGNGTLCVDKFTLPSGLGIVDGQTASLQISTVGPTGAALYNVCLFSVYKFFLIHGKGELGLDVGEITRTQLATLK